MKLIIYASAVALLSALPWSAPQAQEVQSLDQVRAAARQFLAAEHGNTSPAPEVEVDPLDPRLRLTACQQALTAFLPPGARRAGKLTVGVRCSGANPWTIYLSARVRVFQLVVVAERTLPRSAVLGAEDVRLERREVGALTSGFFTDTKEVAGMVLRSTVSPGTLLTASVVSPPRLVRRGQRVTLLAGAGGFEVRSIGSALSEGARGDLVQVRNLGSKRVVEGVVLSEGTVRVSM